MDNNKFKAVLAAVAALVIIPVINSLYGKINAAAAAAVAAAAIIVLVILTVKKPNKKGNDIEPELCSDIRSISIGARGKNYVISAGDGFSIEDNLQTGIMSYVEKGIWRIEDNDDSSNTLGTAAGSAPVEIRIPAEFVPERLEITAERGNVIVLIPAADSVRINNHNGEAEIRKIHTKEIYAETGKGKVKINLSLSGSAQFVCGSGSISAVLENNAEDFNAEAVTGRGSIRIGSELFGAERRSGRIENNAEQNIKVSCGMGSVEIDFGRLYAV
ncbi:MAG: DUF4097 family beta strand repeat-containing protein [bacterium]|nr:DUF4097 family beta strand repeat-containing protein [bacterium]